MLSTCPYVEDVPGPGGLTLSQSFLYNWMLDLSLAITLAQFPEETSPVAHVVTEIYSRSFAIRSCCHTGSLIIGLCHLIQIRVSSQVSQSYIFISYTVKYSWVDSLKLSLRGISMLYLHQPNTFAWFCSLQPCGPMHQWSKKNNKKQNYRR